MGNSNESPNSKPSEKKELAEILPRNHPIKNLTEISDSDFLNACFYSSGKQKKKVMVPNLKDL